MPTPMTFSLDAFAINASSPQVMATLRAIVWNETRMKASDAFSVYVHDKNGVATTKVMASFGPVHFDPKANPVGTADFAVGVLRAAGNDTVANAIEGRNDQGKLVLSSSDCAAINDALQTEAGLCLKSRRFRSVSPEPERQGRSDRASGLGLNPVGPNRFPPCPGSPVPGTVIPESDETGGLP